MAGAVFALYLAGAAILIMFLSRFSDQIQRGFVENETKTNRDGDQNEQPTANSDHDSDAPVVRMVRYVITKFRERRAQKEKEIAQDRFSRRLAHATVAIAFLTAAIVAVAILQYFSGEDQLDVMRGQLSVMQTEEATTKSELAPKMALIPLIDPIKSGGVITAWALTEEIRNQGRTEAIRWNGTDAIVILALNAPHPTFVIPLTKLVNGAPIGDIGVSEVAFLPTLYVPAVDVHRAANGQSNLLLWGTIVLRDIFPGTPVHYRTWCEKLAPNVAPDQTITWGLAVFYSPDCNRSGDYPPQDMSRKHSAHH
jgi:hypothetical protein